MRSKHILITGAQGTGKTELAKKIAAGGRNHTSLSLKEICEPVIYVHSDVQFIIVDGVRKEYLPEVKRIASLVSIKSQLTPNSKVIPITPVLIFVSNDINGTIGLARRFEIFNLSN